MKLKRLTDARTLKTGDRVVWYSEEERCTILDSVATVEGGQVYLCQNTCDGAVCDERHGYDYSWNVGTGTKGDLDRNHVQGLSLAIPD